MAITHTNRKGKTYYLHQGTTKSGKPNYFFALRAEGDLVDSFPPGYEIYENPNSQVFLRRKRPQIITDEEVATVKAGMQQYCRLEKFIVDVKKNAITIYTPDQETDLMADTLGDLFGLEKSMVRSVMEGYLSFSPMMQFVLVDKSRRLFDAQRYCFRGSIDDWITIEYRDDLSNLVKTYVEHLGEESFYDLI